MISCVYCGGEHALAAEVKQCWRRQENAQPEIPPADIKPESPQSARPGPAARPGSASAIRQRGPHALGRHVLVAPGAPDPAGWEGCDRVTLGPEQLVRAEATVSVLRHLHHRAISVIIEFDPALDGRFVADIAPGQTELRPVHELTPGLTLWLDELHHLVFSNSFDGRGGTAPTITTNGDADGVWIDHGPIRYLDPIDGIAVVSAIVYRPGHPTSPLGNESSADLASDQLAAVTHTGGSARIIAPAGSGKTRVLTERARHLIERWQLPAKSICLVAFNKRAQQEMQARTADLSGLQVRTLNSIALAIISGRAPFAAVKARLTTIDEPQVRQILSRLVKIPRRLNVDPISSWIDALSAVRLGMRDPDDVESDYGGDISGLAEVYDQYIAALERAGSVDFDHQIVRAIEVLLGDPDARRAAQIVCRVLLVDEFQDLTPAHLLLVRLLAGPQGAVFGVGDDDQTIYGYNGADPAWLIDFAKWFPGAGDHPLTINYRCPADVVEAADNLMRHNRRRVDKVIKPAPDAPRNGWSTRSSIDPVAETVAAVQSARQSGAATSEIAVLTRVNTTIAPVQVALNIAGVPISGGVGTDYTERTAVRAAFAWLRLTESKQLAAADIGEALRRPSRGLHPRVRDWVGEQRSTEAIRRLADRLNNDKDSRNVREFADDLDRLHAMHQRRASTSEVLQYLVDEIGLGVAVSTLDGGRRGTNRSAQNDDLQAFHQIAALFDKHGSGPFEAWLRSNLAAQRSAEGVVLSTVHRVKGQEWPHVIVHLADQDQYPHRLAEDDEEERRLFHVAITRASQHATIVSGEHPSSFIAELTSEPPEHPVAPLSVGSPPEAHPRREEPQRKQPAHPLADRSKVYAAIGVTLVDQGQEWEIIEIEADAAVASRGEVTRRFALDAKVETRGRQRGFLAPRPGSVSDTSIVAFDELRIFRERAREGKPAYVVFDDKTLAFIAEALPADADELATVKGVGPAKLEQYGDDVLELIEAIREQSDPTP